MKGIKLIIPAVAIILNALVTWYLLHRAWDGNDKAILLVVFGFPILIIFNAFIWVIVRSTAMKYITIASIILFPVVLFLSSLY